MFFKLRRNNKERTELDMSRLPRHIGIIMDGNGRWAKRRGLPRTEGHKHGAKTLENISEHCAKLGIGYITAYAFSTENWSRPAEEVTAIMNLLRDYLAHLEEKFKEKDFRLMVSGDISALDEDIQESIRRAVDVTRGGKAITVNIAINYGGRDEIVRAARAICAKVQKGELGCKDIDEKLFAKHTDTADMPEVDLIIRPSGEKRLSNFLLWQAAYAEFWYSDICWPDFKAEDMNKAILDYQNRDRRFGGV